MQNKIWLLQTYDREVLVNFQNIVQLLPPAEPVEKKRKKESYCKEMDDSNLDSLQSDMCVTNTYNIFKRKLG